MHDEVARNVADRHHASRSLSSLPSTATDVVRRCNRSDIVHRPTATEASSITRMELLTHPEGELIDE